MYPYFRKSVVPEIFSNLSKKSHTAKTKTYAITFFCIGFTNKFAFYMVACGLRLLVA